MYFRVQERNKFYISTFFLLLLFQVIGVQQYLVRPVGTYDLDNSIPNDEKNSSLVSSTTPTDSSEASTNTSPEFSINESLLKIAGRPLGEVIDKVSLFLRHLS